MNEKELDLSSVNWTQGMLLTPEHFLRQERYFDSALLWLTRYATDAYGVVGAGPRVEAAERGAAKHDPLVEVDDDGEWLKISVSQCRGVTPSGDLIELAAAQALHHAFPKAQLEGVPDVGVYLVCQPHDKVTDEGETDAANPQTAAARRARYRVQLDVNAAEAQHSLLLCRLRRAAGSLRFEKLGGFIPVCTTLIGHSELKQAWDRLREQLAALADRYAQLHKAVAEYLSLAEPRNLATREDHETLQFVGRMLLALENGIYDALDPLQPPRRFFQQLYRLVRGAAVYLDLSPTTQEYFRQLARVGVAEFEAVLQEERRTLTQGREFSMHDNLRLDVQRVEEALQRLQQLAEALAGKYLDYRVSDVLESLNFFFDRAHGEAALYQSVVRPVRWQLFEDELTFVIAPKQLEERQSYRLVLIGEPGARPFNVGDEIETEIRLNAEGGQGFDTSYGTAVAELPGQRNVAIDLDRLTETLRITDLRVIINKRWPVRSCRLYVRNRFGLGRAKPQPTPPLPPPPPPVLRPAGPEPAAPYKHEDAPPSRRPGGRLTPLAAPPEEPYEERLPPRKSGRFSPLEEPSDEPPERPTQVKRRRLE